MFLFDKVYLICIASEKEFVFYTCYVVSTLNKQVRSDERLSTNFFIDLRREAESSLSFANSVIGRRLRTSDDNDLEHVMNTESSL